MIRVVVVDDQALVRMGLRTLVAGEDDIELVGEAGDGREALSVIRRTRPDVVLLDIRMPVLDGLATLAEVTADASLEAVKVVMLTTFELDDYVFAALRGGASGFVLKDDSPEQLIAAIRTVAAGDALLSPTVTRRVIEQFAATARPAPPKELDELSDRERDVFRLIAQGMSNAEIGQELFISETTVKTHVTHILGKLGLRDRVQAVVLAHQTGFVDAS